MLKKEVLAIGYALLREHGLYNWTIEFTRAKVEVAHCNHRLKRIGFSDHFARVLPESDVVDTFKHEIAHALTPGHGHDKVWKAKAIEIGCNGERQYDKEVEVPKSKWTGLCPNGHKFARHRLTSKIRNGVSCNKCSPVYDPAYRIKWVETEEYERLGVVTV